MERLYLDYTATTPLDPSVLEAMKPYFLEEFGNPSSVHTFGQRARAALDASREKLASLIGASQGELFFMSGGTESDNFAIKGAALKMRQRGKRHIITSGVEHHAVLESCTYLAEQGFEITYLPVDQYGIVNPETVRSAIRPESGLISIMHANNEVGSLNPVKSIGAIAREHGLIFHTDAVQSFGKIPVDVNDLCADLLTISAHKIYGPKGIGALYLRKGIDLEQFMHGGTQERGRRAGTESVPLAVGFAEAASLICASREKEFARIRVLKNKFRAMLEEKFPSVIVNGHPVNSLPQILSVSFDSGQMELDSEALLFNLDLAGVAVSSGSACTSGSIKPSHVLLAMGRDPQTARATLRFSFGRWTDDEVLEKTFGILGETVDRIATFKV